MLHTSHSILKCRFSVHYRLPKLNGIERNGDNFIVDDQLLVDWGYIDIIIIMTDKLLSQHEVNVQHVELISMWDTATMVLENLLSSFPCPEGARKLVEFIRMSAKFMKEPGMKITILQSSRGGYGM